jgi:hypothetical protein
LVLTEEQAVNPEAYSPVIPLILVRRGTHTNELCHISE